MTYNNHLNFKAKECVNIMIELIVFDLDGVLVDTCDIHYNALNQAMQENLGYTISREDHVTKFNGLSTKKKLAMLNVDISLQETINKRKQELTHIEMKMLPKSDTLVSVMKTIKDRGIHLMCASNCVRSTIEIVLKQLGIFEFFDKVLSNEDVNAPKPSPEIYIKCMEHAGVSPANTLVFEDSYVGLQAALKSGANVHRVDSPNSLSADYVMTATENLTSHVNIVIPMAGNGSRFTSAGYKDPKPFIPVFGNPMISWVVKNMGVKAKYTFIIRKEFDEVYNASSYLKTIVENCNIVTVDKTTEGAACTVLLAKKYIDNSNPIIIINSDQYIEFDDCPDATKFIFDFLYNPAEQVFDGKISTFNGERHPKWSYARVGDDGVITEVREKDPFSEHATTGLYMWRRGSDFVKYAGQMIEKNIRVNNEFYVVPVFNEAINDGLKFEICGCKRMWGIGVPEDLNYFLDNYQLKIALSYSEEPRDIKNTFRNHREMIFQRH
jgi:HAD superfamily hydrolase (TIGR01509 family)